jgi:hypothetical protein
MGGLFTVLKVRENLENYEDPGWYQHPPGTVAAIAKPEELKRDAIELPKDLAPLARRRSPAHPWCGSPKPASQFLAKNPASSQ